ncbi:hypothetical protein [Mannheimia varigena]|uniref:hypothetical protein n=1 Tax=Mannheimia varigena TaxID=85404 RepID=UPI0015B62ACD|nr:hypothetical protein [Mannheimia varigena]QLD32386.1 hypothetical protein A6B42_00735 [Mannheimia varigena]
MIENILNTFDITNITTNIIWIAVGAFLQFMISKILNKLKRIFSYDENKIIRKLSESDKFLLKEEDSLLSCSEEVLENLEKLGVIRITYPDINVTDAFGTILLYKTQDKSSPNIVLTDIGIKIKDILNKTKRTNK